MCKICDTNFVHTFCTNCAHERVKSMNSWGKHRVHRVCTQCVTRHNFCTIFVKFCVWKKNSRWWSTEKFLQQRVHRGFSKTPCFAEESHSKCWCKIPRCTKPISKIADKIRYVEALHTLRGAQTAKKVPKSNLELRKQPHFCQNLAKNRENRLIATWKHEFLALVTRNISWHHLVVSFVLRNTRLFFSRVQRGFDAIFWHQFCQKLTNFGKFLQIFGLCAHFCAHETSRWSWAKRARAHSVHKFVHKFAQILQNFLFVFKRLLKNAKNLQDRAVKQPKKSIKF